MTKFAFPEVKGGRVTNCIFSPTGAITAIWIVLDNGVTEVEFIEKGVAISYDAAIHLNSVAGTDAK